MPGFGGNRRGVARQVVEAIVGSDGERAQMRVAMPKHQVLVAHGPVTRIVRHAAGDPGAGCKWRMVPFNRSTTTKSNAVPARFSSQTPTSESRQYNQPREIAQHIYRF